MKMLNRSWNYRGHVLRKGSVGGVREHEEDKEEEEMARGGSSRLEAVDEMAEDCMRWG